jgi:hypothetical protein
VPLYFLQTVQTDAHALKTGHQDVEFPLIYHIA